jgi:hypothetical protein
MSGTPAAVPPAPIPPISARALASRINGAKSRGPKTEEGKARSSQNALKHGLRAQKFVVLRHEDAAGYEAHERALLAELRPEGPLRTLLAQRVAAAAWRLERADRMEAELFEQQGTGDGDLGLALIRDCNGARAFPTLLRYRGAALADFWRALKALNALQAEAAAAGLAPPLMVESGRGRFPEAPTHDQRPRRDGGCGNPKEPEARADPQESAPVSPANEPRAEERAERPAGGPDPAPAGRGQERCPGAIAALAAPDDRTVPAHAGSVRDSPLRLGSAYPAPVTASGAGGRR